MKIVLKLLQSELFLYIATPEALNGYFKDEVYVEISDIPFYKE